jgi:hypothetical protein
LALPADLRPILPPGAAEAWEDIAPVLPNSCRLARGTGLAVHLHHRQSRDLDFFYTDGDLALAALAEQLSAAGSFAATRSAPGSLSGVFQQTRVQFFDAHDQAYLAEPESRAGIPISSLADIFAMKVKVIGDRGELRDYFDLKRIEELTGRRFEEGIALYMDRYRIPPEHASIGHIVEALGYLDDVDEDEMLPEDHKTIASYWKRRQPEISRGLSRFPGV